MYFPQPRKYRDFYAGACKIGLLMLFFTLFLQGLHTVAQPSRSSMDTLDVMKKIELFIELSTEYTNNNIDSAIYYAEQSNVLIENLTSDSAKAAVYKNLGAVYRARGNHALSLDYLFKAERLIDQELEDNPKNLNMTHMKANLFGVIGVNYFYQMNYDKALYYYDQALLLLDEVKQGDTSIYDNYDKIKIFNNMAGIYIRTNEYKRAIEYYKTSLELMGDDNKNLLASSLYNNLGICYLEQYDFETAFYNLQKSLEIREREADKRGMAQCYNNIGKNYFYQKNYEEAKRYNLRALELGKEIGNLESIRISLQALTSLYDSIGDYTNAYHTFKELKITSDSIYNAESIARISQLEMQHEFEQQQRIFDLEIKRREAEEQKRNLIYLVVGALLFFSLLTAILLIGLQRNKIKHARLEKEHLELEGRHLGLEKEKLKAQLDFKNRELTTNVMYLLKKNELITNISEKLIKSKLDFKKENQRIIQEIINELKSSQDSDTWAEFEAHFTQVHTDFYARLNKEYPNLSANEKKLCAFLRLNMSTKDIAAITYQSVNSITVARSRLRKKLNIEGEDVNLTNFLAQF